MSRYFAAHRPSVRRNRRLACGPCVRFPRGLSPSLRASHRAYDNRRTCYAIRAQTRQIGFVSHDHPRHAAVPRPRMEWWNDGMLGKGYAPADGKLGSFFQPDPHFQAKNEGIGFVSHSRRRFAGGRAGKLGLFRTMVSHFFRSLREAQQACPREGGGSNLDPANWLCFARPAAGNWVCFAQLPPGARG